MEGSYEITLAGEQVGTAKVTRRGLYYGIDCRCQLLRSNVYDLTARWGNQSMHIGIPVPDGNSLHLGKTVPVKSAGQGSPVFILTPRHEKSAGRFVPVYPEEPFSYLRRLEGAYLEVRQGQVGIVLDAQKNVK